MRWGRAVLMRHTVTEPAALFSRPGCAGWGRLLSCLPQIRRDIPIPAVVPRIYLPLLVALAVACAVLMGQVHFFEDREAYLRLFVLFGAGSACPATASRSVPGSWSRPRCRWRSSTRPACSRTPSACGWCMPCSGWPMCPSCTGSTGRGLLLRPLHLRLPHRADPAPVLPRHPAAANVRRSQRADPGLCHALLALRRAAGAKAQERTLPRRAAPVRHCQLRHRKLRSEACQSYPSRFISSQSSSG
jgi:hypothetical protein